MRVVILGAAGRTGRATVDAAVGAGHSVVAFARTTDGVPTSPGVSVVAGDASDVTDLKAAFQDADAVISTLGGKGSSLMTDATRAVLAAARGTGVKRATVLSSFAVQRDRLATGTKLISGLAMRSMIADKAAAEAELRAGELDWTILYATVLGDGPASGSAHVVPDAAKITMRDKISRADVARWLIDVTVSDDFRRQDVTITG